ncbi:DUF3460 domain-containing protein [Snodgrassella alvi]|uniref:DUF3460 domain-containing protein n=1 Tax=Snodgrassella alvi TaxID=1196083 RepID=A0A2N9WT65_9NEIS|nr:DUF3460 family protein [Snodgrassella alvi]PIT14525.1 DUF3460 domain-containing protein [Snodgrassella alvi]
MYNYQSDTTQFLNEFMAKHPEEVQVQLKHRAMLWDVQLNPEDEANFAAAKLPKKGYTYLTE